MIAYEQSKEGFNNANVCIVSLMVRVFLVFIIVPVLL